MSGDLLAWVAAKPLERAPAVAVPAVTMATALCAALPPSPEWAAALATVTASGAVVAREYGRRSGGSTWGTTLAGTALAGAAWPVAALGGAVDLNDPTALCALAVTAAGGTVMWLRADRPGAGAGWRKLQRTWSKVGIEGSSCERMEETTSGERYVIDVRGCKGGASGAPLATITEKVAAHLGLPVTAVTTTIDRKGAAGRLVVEVRRRDPWAPVLHHPMSAAGAGLVDRDEFQAGRTALTPVTLGTVPDGGRALELPLWTGQGAQHTTVVGSSGGGKSCLLNVVLEHVTGCPDVEVWAANGGKGGPLRPWAPLLERVALGYGEVDVFLQMTRDFLSAIRERDDLSDGGNHTPSPEHPARILIVDEVPQAISHPEFGKEIAANLALIAALGRASAHALFVVTQRATLGGIGDTGLTANSMNLVVLPLQKRQEMDYARPRWRDSGLPDMSEIRTPGAILVETKKGWTLGKGLFLEESEDIRAIVASRVEGPVPDSVPEPVRPAPVAPEPPVMAGALDRLDRLATCLEASPPLVAGADLVLARVGDGEVPRAELEEAMGCGKTTAAARLRAMVEAGQLEVVGGGPQTRYRRPLVTVGD